MLKHLTRLGDNHVQALQRIAPGSLLASVAPSLPGYELEKYNTDWTREFSGKCRLVLRPREERELAEAVRYCHLNRLGIVPQGGNTGLVGAGVPLEEEIVVSMERMNAIRGVDDLNSFITLQAGVVLETADEYARKHDKIMPLDLGSKGSCMVGGNVATNAGGTRFVRYGSLRGNVLGLRAVMADGSVLDELKSVRKDNTGYDLKQLLIGSEGTLGIITEICMALHPRPASRLVALFAARDFTKALKLFQLARASLGETLSACEYFDGDCMRLVTRELKLRHPFLASRGVGSDTSNTEVDAEPAFYVLVECAGAEPRHDREKMEMLIERAAEAGCEEGVLAEDEAHFAALWALRERISVALRSPHHSTLKYDVSLHSSLLDEATRTVRLRLEAFAREAGLGEGYARIYQYGHLADNNLHFNARCLKGQGAEGARAATAARAVIEDTLYAYIKAHGGSISAEHGVGVLKRDKLPKYARGPAAMDALRGIKRLFDPNGIMNPGKVL